MANLENQAVITRDTHEFFHELKARSLKGSFAKLINKVELAHQLAVAKKCLDKAKMVGQSYRVKQLEELISISPKIMRAVHMGY